MDDETQKPTTAAMIALAGAPNAGKSTLLNEILGRRVSITTEKPQTTQTRILGIEMRDRTQLIFTDTPGIHEPRGTIHELMVGRARSSIGGADIVCWVVDGKKGLGRVDRAELPRLREQLAQAEHAERQPLVIVLNKIDLVAKTKLLPTMAELTKIAPEIECFPVSALRGEGAK